MFIVENDLLLVISDRGSGYYVENLIKSTDASGECNQYLRLLRYDIFAVTQIAGVNFFV